LTQNASDTTGAPGAPPQGKRAQAIAERRRRLVKAASELIAERDEGAFSMPELAARAGLSLATPYNLFGSKAAVLGEVFARQVRGFHRDNGWMEEADPVARILGVVDRLVAAYAREPRFFRNLWKAFHTLSPGEHHQMGVPGGGHLLAPLVHSLAASGALIADVPPALVEITLIRLFEANFEQWALQGWDIDQLRAGLQASFALVFLGLLDTPCRAPLEATIRAAAPVLAPPQ